MAGGDVTALEVDRGDLRRTRVVVGAPAALSPGRARLRVDAFALTANNITYGAFGDALGYWSFFPTDAPEWGRIPVWGFAEVTESTVDDLEVGRRVYGFLPMSDELVVEPGRFDARGFADTAEHRRPMAGAYNRYGFTDADPAHDPDREAQQMLLWPLFVTAFLIDDHLEDAGLLPGTVVCSSASSKTAIALATLCARRPGVRVVGLTSARNLEFVRSLGCYAEVLAYGEALPAGTGAVYVDVAGDPEVTAAVHDRLDLRASLVVGGTHWDRDRSGPPVAPPRPELFFAPARIAQRHADWGPDGFDARLGAAWSGFSGATDAWLEVERAVGPAAVEAAYRTVVEGRVEPKIGYVCTMGAQ